MPRTGCWTRQDTRCQNSETGNHAEMHGGRCAGGETTEKAFHTYS